MQFFLTIILTNNNSQYGLDNKRKMRAIILSFKLNTNFGVTTLTIMDFFNVIYEGRPEMKERCGLVE